MDFGVGVASPPGVLVIVGGRVGVGVTKFTRTINFWPTSIRFRSVMLFSSMISSIVELNNAAIKSNESPLLTVYSIRVPRGKLSGTGVSVGIT